MSGPFSSLNPNGRPVWSVVPTIDGNFAPSSSVVEIGYGEGGYGEDGYDSPGISVSGTPQPVWSVETTR